MPNSAVTNSDRIFGLEREVYPAPDHAEIIVRTVHDVPAEIVDPADVASEPNLETSANLAHQLCLAVAVRRDKRGSGRARADNTISLTAAEDPAEPAEYVGRESGTADWITKRQCAQRASDDSLIVGFGKHKRTG